MTDTLGHNKKYKILKNNITRTIAVMAIALVITFICMIPCYDAGIIDGSDIDFHMARIYAIYNSIKTGQGINPYIYQTYLSGYGYALGLFYPAVFLIPFAMLKAVTGISIMLTMKIFIAVCFLATCFTSYIAGKNISGKTNIGIMVMIIYTMGQYHFVNAYPRSAMGEFSAMIFIPLVFLGGYELCERKYKKGILSIAFTGLVISNTISTVICLLFLFVWVLIRIKRIIKRKYIFGVLVEACLCLLITAFYWLPAIEQFWHDGFYCFTKGWSDLAGTTLTLDEFYAGYSVAFIEYGILLLVIFIGLHLKKYSKKAIGFSLMAIFLLIIQTKIFPWSLVENTIFRCIQFTFRVNILSEFAVAMAISSQVNVLIPKLTYQKDNLKTIADLIFLYALFILIGCINLFTATQACQYGIFMDNDFKNCSILGMAEWFPDSVDLQYIVYSQYSGLVKLENGYVSGSYNDDGSYVFVIDDSYTGFAEIPKIYYKGYTAIATSDIGEETELSVFESENGLVYIDIPENTVGIKVWYRGTFLQDFGKCTSLVTILLIIIFFCCFKLKKIIILRRKDYEISL